MESQWMYSTGGMPGKIPLDDISLNCLKKKNKTCEISLQKIVKKSLEETWQQLQSVNH